MSDLTALQVRIDRQYQVAAQQAVEMLHPIVYLWPEPEEPVRQMQLTPPREATLLGLLDMARISADRASLAVAQPVAGESPLNIQSRFIAMLLSSMINVLHDAPVTARRYPLAMVLYAGLTSMPNSLFSSPEDAP